MSPPCLRRGPRLSALLHDSVDVDATFDLCALAWRDRKGYVVLSVRDATKAKDEQGYWKDVAFTWPQQSAEIRSTLDVAARSHKDVYFSPAVYSKAKRSSAAVLDTPTLWADLDDIDPRELPKHLKPTAAWESSPGRYQAIWDLSVSLDPSKQSELNRRLTYAVGADKGGWDLTQVLRLPGTHNHKYPDRPEVKLLWRNGTKLDPARLIDDLPELNGHKVDELTETLPEPSDVVRRYKLNAHVTQLLRARHATVGTRSEKLWELECLLAEHGLNQAEIVSLVKGTVWNKFYGRTDEINRLFTEAAKAIEHVVPVQAPVSFPNFEVTEETGPIPWVDFDRQHEEINWLIADVWGDAEVGFISGLPKSYKSWIALDFAVSVATGTRFLGSFETKKHPVILVQEEDPRPVLQDRLAKIGAAKGLIYAKTTGGHSFEMRYELPEELYVISNQGFVINDEWLDQTETWIKEREAKLLILDPLMMIADGNFDEFKAFEFMEKVLKPLKRLRASTGCAICVVHHHLKSGGDGARAMYGSVALWAWEEAALHLQVSGIGKVTAERFSKHAILSPLLIDVKDTGEQWDPEIDTASHSDSALYDLLLTMDAGATIDELVIGTGQGRDSLQRQLARLIETEKVVKERDGSSGKGGRAPFRYYAKQR